MADAAQIVIDDAEINAALDRVARAGVDTAPLMQRIEGIMLRGVQTRFETERAPDGAPWQRLSPRTASKRIGRGTRGYNNILRVSGRLYSSISSESDERSAEVGTNLPYAAAHQDGATITQYAQSRTIRLRKVKGRVQFARKAHKRATEKRVTIGERTITIPARPYLGFSDEDRAEILAATESYFEEAAGGDAK
ncbi:phage virion morphogenesis protein [Oricola indica]|uniref:phage virion morphogenesis protein n=1 Tax=Oricola indica TaxID=2872591 RepID=UPI003CCBBB21